MEEFFPRSDRACTFLPKFFHETKPQALELGKHPFFLDPEGMEGAAVLPGSLATVPAYAFSRCTKLSAITFGGTSSSVYTSENGLLYTADKQTLVAAPPALGTTTLIAPETKYIEQGAFAANTDLSTIVVTGVVEGIETGETINLGGQIIQTVYPAFNQNTISNAKVALNVSPEDADAAKAVFELIGFTHFSEPATPGTEVLPSTETTEGEDGEEVKQTSGFAFTLLDDYTLSVRWEPGTNNDPAPQTVDIPTQGTLNDITYAVSSIADDAFKGQTSLEAINIPNTIAYIGAHAFEGTSIQAISIPGSVTEIGESAFANNENLVAIDIISGITSIGDYAFANIATNTIVLPKTIEAVGDYAFANSPNLETILALGEVSQVGASALSSNTNVKLYVPYNEQETYAWALGAPVSNNHLLPYGVKISDEPITLQEGQTANLFDNGGYLKIPEGFEVNYSYKAKPLSVDSEGNIEAKQAGSTNVEATISFDFNQTVVDGITNNEMKLSPAAYTQNATIHQAAETVTIPATYTWSDNGGIEVMALADPIDEGISVQADFSYDDYFLKNSLGNGTCEIKANPNVANPPTVLRIPSTFQGEKVVAIASYGFAGSNNGSSANHSAAWCKDLVSVSIPTTVTSIKPYGFFDSGLQSIDIPNSVTTLERYSFYSCQNLVSVRIPASVKQIGTESDGYSLNIFSLSYNLESIEVDERNTQFRSQDGVLYTKDMKQLISYPVRNSMKRFDIPEGVEVVHDYNFFLVPNLEAISLPSSLTRLGSHSFESLASMKEIYSYGTPIVDEYYNLRHCYIPITVYCLGSEKDTWLSLKKADYCSQLVVKTIDDSETYFLKNSLGNGTCEIKANPNVANPPTVLRIPSTFQGETVVSIASYGFAASNNGSSANHSAAWCRNLVSVSIPTTVTMIEPYGFFYSGLQSIDIPNSVISIGVYAFYSCSNLTTARISSSVIKIGADSANSNIFTTFDGNLRSIEVDSDNPNYCSQDGVLYTKDMKQLVSYPRAKTASVFNVPEGVESIHAYNFVANPFLETLILPSTLKHIDRYSLSYGNPSLKYIYSYGSPNIFEPQSNLQGYSNPLTVYCLTSEIAKWEEWKKDKYCPQMEIYPIDGIDDYFLKNSLGNGTCEIKANPNVANPPTVLRIPSTFQGETVVAIASYGFAGSNNGSSANHSAAWCKDLVSVSIPTTVTTIKPYGFFYSGLQSIDIPNSVTTLERYSFYSCHNLVSVRIPASVQQIGSASDGYSLNIFSLSLNLEFIEVDERNTQFCSQDGVLYTKDMKQLISYPVRNSMKRFDIPEGVEVVHDYNFFLVPNLEAISLPSSLTYLGNHTLESLASMKEIYSYGTPILQNFWGTLQSCYIPITVYCLGSEKDSWLSLKKEGYCPELVVIAYDEKLLKVLFNANANDSSIKDMPLPRSVNQGSHLQQVTSPTRTGYTFAGWFREKECINQFQFGGTGNTVPDDMTLYAKWDINTYNITYRSAEENVDWSNTKITYTVEDTRNGLVLTYPEKIGYVFNGWTGIADESGSSEASSANPTEITKDYKIPEGTIGDLAFEAHFTMGKYDLEFVFPSSGEAISMPNKKEGLTIETLGETYPGTNDVSRLGYTLDKWAIVIGDKTNTYTSGSNIDLLALLTENKGSSSITETEVGATIALTAVWIENIYKIEFEATLGGETIAQARTALYTHGIDSLPQENDCTFPKYKKLSGWSTTNGSGGTVYALDMVTLPSPKDLIAAGASLNVSSADNGVDGTITLYTVWADSLYVITYNNNSDAAIGDADEVSKAPATIGPATYDEITNATPIKRTGKLEDTTGYTFDGWTYKHGSTVANIDNQNKPITSALFDVIFDGCVSGDATVELVAVWGAKKFTFKWDNSLVGALHNANEATDIGPTAYNQEITLPLANAAGLAYSNPGYTLDAWLVSSADGAASLGAPGAKRYVYELIADGATKNGTEVTLYANWKAGDATSEILYFFQDPSDGEYKESVDKGQITGKSGDSVDLISSGYAPEVKTGGAYSYMRIDHINDLLSGTLNSDEPPVFKVYYKLQLVVVFDPGTYGSGDKKTVTNVNWGDKLAVENMIEFAPTNDKAYEFMGWVSGSASDIVSTEAIKNTAIKDNATYTAQWKDIVYTINYVVDENKTEHPNATTITYDGLKAANSSFATPVNKVGYTFEGWCKDASANVVDYAAGETITLDEAFGSAGIFADAPNTRAVNVNAKCIENSYVLEFHKLKSASVLEVVGLEGSYAYTSKVVLPVQSALSYGTGDNAKDDAKMVGYMLAGWSVKNGASISTNIQNESYTFAMGADIEISKLIEAAGGKEIDIVGTGNNAKRIIKLYAVWQPVYNVEVPDDSLTANMSIDVSVKPYKVEPEKGTDGENKLITVKSYTPRAITVGAFSTPAKDASQLFNGTTSRYNEVSFVWNDVEIPFGTTSGGRGAQVEVVELAAATGGKARTYPSDLTMKLGPNVVITPSLDGAEQIGEKLTRKWGKIADITWVVAIPELADQDTGWYLQNQ